MATFDAVKYKQATREQWQRAAEPWHAWGPTIESWLGEATELMLDLAGVGLGARVLDVAAGAGGQTLRAAERVGPTGAVLATDIAPAILEYAARVAREAYPDPTSEDDWSAVDIEPVRALARPVSLDELRSHPVLGKMMIFRRPRLSVVPVTPEEYELVLAVSKKP